MKKGVSIIICCYNSALRLPQTLKHIAQQHVSEAIQWEVIVVNNKSIDNTERVALIEWKKHLYCKAEFSIINESKPGLSNARKAGILNAKYAYSIFCDDDNWLDENYIQIAYDIMESNSEIGMLGGQSEAVCEITPPEWFEKKIGGYAVGKQAINSGDISSRMFLWGAGVILKTDYIKKVYNSSVISLLSDRKGKELTSGGDSEISAWYLIANYKIWYDDKLKFMHYVPKERLTEQYRDMLWQGFDQSSSILKSYYRYIHFLEELKKESRIKKGAKALIKYGLVKLGVKRFSKEITYHKQDIQLCTHSKIEFDENLKMVNDNGNKLKKIINKQH